MAACAAGGAAVSDAKGNTTTTTYDSKGRVTKKGFANKGSLLYTYTEGFPMYDFAEMQEGLCRSYLTLSPEIFPLVSFGTPTVNKIWSPGKKIAALLF